MARRVALVRHATLAAVAVVAAIGAGAAFAWAWGEFDPTGWYFAAVMEWAGVGFRELAYARSPTGPWTATPARHPNLFESATLAAQWVAFAVAAVPLAWARVGWIATRSSADWPFAHRTATGLFRATGRRLATVAAPVTALVIVLLLPAALVPTGAGLFPVEVAGQLVSIAWYAVPFVVFLLVGLHEATRPRTRTRHDHE